MDQFIIWKKNFLSKKDKSNKGSIDKGVRSLISVINNHPDYFTTSSCSGRITLWVEPLSGRKNDVTFLFSSHDTAKPLIILDKLENITHETVWFRFEPMILHVCCRTLETSDSLLAVSRPLFKHSGIITAGRKIIVELRGSEHMEAPISISGRLVTNKTYVKTLVTLANNKLRINQKKINKLTILLVSLPAV